MNTVTHVLERVLPMSPVYTVGEGPGERGKGVNRF